MGRLRSKMSMHMAQPQKSFILSFPFLNDEWIDDIIIPDILSGGI